MRQSHVSVTAAHKGGSETIPVISVVSYPLYSSAAVARHADIPVLFRPVRSGDTNEARVTARDTKYILLNYLK